MSSKEKAVELIADYLEMQSTSVDMSDNYRLAKIFAKYAANTAKWSHRADSSQFSYWEDVKKEIDLL